MKISTAATLAIMFCLAVSPASAARRRAVVPGSNTLSIVFVEVPTAGSALLAAGSDAWFDLNAISQQPGSTGTSIRIRRQFGIRVLRAGGVSWGTATVTARLNARDGRSTTRIDGKSLGVTPVTVDTRAVIGRTHLHTIEIEVPESASEGPLATTISWEVTAQ